MHAERIFAVIGRYKWSASLVISRVWAIEPTPLRPGTPTAIAYTSTFRSTFMPAATYKHSTLIHHLLVRLLLIGRLPHQ